MKTRAARLPLLIALGALASVAVGLLIVRLGSSMTLAIVGRLLFGWVAYLSRVLPQVAVSKDGAATALVCLVLFTTGLHAFLRWWHREVQRRAVPVGPLTRPWPIRRTASLVFLVLVTFVAGIAATGIVHQAGWLLTAKDAWTPVRRAVWSYNNGFDSKGRLRMMGLGMLNYASSRHQLPSTRYDEHDARLLHSWQTDLLPYTWDSAATADLIDGSQPWNTPRNSAVFRGIVPGFLNPDITPIRNREGYALSHYAGNTHILGRRRPFPAPESTSIPASLILAGEVAEGFKPWGDPTNLRDPIRGAEGTADGFGNPAGTGAQFLFGDGSVRFLSRTTNPQVLTRHSLPGPDGGGPKPPSPPK